MSKKRSPFEIIHPGTYTIYLFIFPDGMRYVGKTKNDVKTRWQGGAHYENNKTLRIAIDTVGWKNVEKVILHEGLSRKAAAAWEKIEIARNHSLHPDGYNCTTGGDSGYAVRNAHVVPVCQYNKETGELIQQYPSIANAGRRTGINPEHISACIRGKRKSAGGFVWKAAEK